MAEERRITIRGKQRRQIDPALIAQILVLLGKQLSQQRGTGHSGEGMSR